MPEPHNGAAHGVINGDLYVVGGVTTGYGQQVNVYDPVADTWTTKAADPVAQSSPAFGVINGKLYVAGGSRASIGLGYTNALEVYDPTSDTWTAKAPMPSAIASAASGVINGKLYVAGGGLDAPSYTTLNTLEVYDPATDTWTTKAPLPSPRTGLDGESAVINGLLYVVGGRAGQPDTTAVNTLEVYNPATNTWATEAPMSTARIAPGVGVLNGILYAAGGRDGASNALATVESYNPATDTWTTEESLLTSRNAPDADGLNGKLYVTGGSADGRVFTTVEAFTPTPPKITSLSLDHPGILENQSVTLTGAFTPAALQTHQVSVNWGDGTSSSLALAAGTNTFSTAHLYKEDAVSLSGSISLPITVTVTANDGGTDTAGMSVIVSEAPVIVEPLQPPVILQGVATGSVPVAVFQDTGGGEPKTDYVAGIDWGDGTVAGGAYTISVGAGGIITVKSNHVYARPGSYDRHVTLLDDNLPAGSTSYTVSVAADVSAAVHVNRSGLYYNRGDQLFYGTLTITNTSTGSLSGALRVLLAGLTHGVTLAYASNTLGTTTHSLAITATGAGDPIISIPKSLVQSLAPGLSLKISVRFRDPALALIGYTPKTFSDPLSD